MATVRAVYEFLGVDPSFTDETLEREFYRTKDRTVRSFVPLWLRKGLKRYVPTSKRFKEFESNMFVRLARRYPSVQRVREAKSFMIPDDVRQRLLEHLRDDVQRLKRYMGPEFTGWGIA
jgi:hypothetical protein